jgi:hypothetical protein
MVRIYLAIASSLAIAGCVMPPTAAQRLSDSAYDFNTAARFGRMDIAGEHVREVARDEFVKKHAGWGKAIRIEDIELNGMTMRKDGDADVSITVTWQRASETSMRATDITQRWTSTRGTWSIISEEERSGDKGLINDVDTKVDEAAPSASPRPRYQTRVIYDQ